MTQLFRYLFWGLCTTLVNVLCFVLMRSLTELPLAAATAIAWFIAVVFAFFVNKYFVFSVRQAFRALLPSFLLFLGTRLFSGVLDVALMQMLVTLLHANELFSKILINVFVVILNYLLGKYLVFSGEKP